MYKIEALFILTLLLCGNYKDNVQKQVSERNLIAGLNKVNFTLKNVDKISYVISFSKTSYGKQKITMNLRWWTRLTKIVVRILL